MKGVPKLFYAGKETKFVEWLRLCQHEGGARLPFIPKSVYSKSPSWNPNETRLAFGLVEMRRAGPRKGKRYLLTEAGRGFLELLDKDRPAAELMLALIGQKS
ncbi:MAG TPA: hypothetical protein VKT73_15310 [Xanthobacteraceae bacterium]|nr:hypothetical protein [Xanthobacteraceae bacterium]